jgi:hypothetical protein
LDSGGFPRNSYLRGEGQNNGNIQATAYAILALAELDRTTYLEDIQKAADYIEGKQLPTGGWEYQTGEDENNQVTGEALWGIATAYKTGDITAHKFNDLLNGDGVQQVVEPSLSDWEMKLYQGFDCTGMPLMSGFTDLDGNVIFSMPPGKYSAMETLKTGWQNTTNLCQNVTLTDEGSEIVSFGNREKPPETGTITAHKFNDLLNGDGVQDAGDLPLSDWEMKLYQGFGCTGTSLMSGLTDMDGNLIFSNLQAGEYSVMETLKTGWKNTTNLCQDVTLTAGGSEVVSFGNREQPPMTCIDLIKTGPETADPGETITYHFEVRNCGQVILAGGAQVYDPLFGSSPIWSGELLPGASHEFDKSYTLPRDQCGKFKNEAWAIGHPPGYPEVRDDASWTVDVSCHTGECQPGTFTFKGSDLPSGPAGNIKIFTLNGANVKVSGWSRDKDTGAYAPAYVGDYPVGLGVTDLASDGNGSSNQHTVDNEGAENYLLFEFDRPVVPDQLYLGYVVTDSDATLWFGSAPAGAQLSDALLNGLNTEDNLGNDSLRWVDFNNGSQVGNILVVAARIGDADDHFKVQKLTYTCPKGKIIVEKQTDPDGANESFESSADFGPNFSLQDDDVYASPPLDPGTYAVSEVNIPDGWKLTGDTCSDGSQPEDIDLSTGETVTCTFNNTEIPNKK